MSGRVPNLRFKQDDGSDFPNWKIDTLKKNARIYDGTHQTPKYVKEGVPFYSVEQVTANNFENTKYIAEDVFQKEIQRVQLNKNDILMTRIGDIGTCKLVDWDVRASFYVSLALIKSGMNVYPSFLAQAIRTDFFQKELHQRTIHVAFPRKINLGEIGECNIMIPHLKEQQKIASFLNAVDEKIEYLERRLELLQTYKRGVLQKLFSQEMRFKRADGSAFPDWEFIEFGNVFDFYRTNSLSRAQLSYKTGNVQNIHYGDIHTRFSTHFKQQHEKIPYIDESETTYLFSADENCQVGDLVIADASEDYKDIGKAIEIVATTDTPLVAGLHTFLARPRESTFVVGFTGYIMQAESMRKEIMRLAQGISVLGISKTQLSKVVISKPCLEEQQKIASFLSAIDTKLDAVSTQISQMQTFKKGLLQQMFV